MARRRRRRVSKKKASSTGFMPKNRNRKDSQPTMNKVGKI